jgi:uncharacterized protein (DUF488 family)
MNREIETMISYGYLATEKMNAGSPFVLGATPNPHRLPATIDSAITTTLERYVGVAQRELLRDVYARYPWYALNSELTDLLPVQMPRRGAAEMAVYTIGYHGTSIDSFANRLLREGIRSVLDVRANPISRKYGFARSSLQSICRKVGLAYHHFPGLGISSSERRGVSGIKAFNTLFSHYERHTLAQNTTDISAASVLIKSAPSVLLCAETNASECHRGRLAVAVANNTGLPIINF